MRLSLSGSTVRHIIRIGAITPTGASRGSGSSNSWSPACIVNAGVANRRVVGERHANAAFASLGLEWLRDRNPIHGEMVDLKFIPA
jgi:hypothetical protein